jgi:hypothetical protein
VVTDTNTEVLDTSVIERLRAMTPETVTKVTVEQVVEILDVVSESPWYGPEAIAERVGLSADEVMDLIRDLGTWAGQAFGTDDGIAVVEAADAAVSDDDGQLQLLPTHRAGIVVIPLGFERRITRRELDRAIANVVSLNATVRITAERAASKGLSRKERAQYTALLEDARAQREVTVSRWLLRRYHQVRQVLTYPVVAGVHRVAQLGRLNELDSLALGRNGWRNTELARVLVEGFDLLDVARLDALDGLATLTEVAQRPEIDLDLDADQLRRAITKTRWVAQGDIGRLAEALERSVEAGYDLGLARQLRLVAAKAERSWPLGSIAELSDGHVQRIAEASGLSIEDSSFAEEALVRRMITEAGLDVDADVLFNDGLRVVQAGLVEAFAAALARRATGDPEWAAELNASLAALGPVSEDAA